VGFYRKYLLVLVSATFLLPVFCYAQVSKIVFTTDPQTILPSVLSSPITIQTQDSAGSLYQTPETIDLEFISTSATAEFLGSTGSPTTKTMSKNTANRTFYYRDSSVGTFTITINAKGRDSGTTWSANQVVTISNSSSTSTTTSTTEESATTNQSSSDSSDQSSSPSAHYSAIPISDLETELKFEVSAGRNRLGTTGSPLEFKVETNVKYTRGNIFKWNFGDGAIGYGVALSHVYEYPGEYAVVLNTSFPEGEAVSRVNVKIIEPELVIVLATPERVEIRNNSKYEVSLFGRALVAGDQVFAFHQDTIIKTGQSVSFGSKVTGLYATGQSRVSLLVVGTEAKPWDILAKIEQQKQLEMARISAQLSLLRDELAKLEVEDHKSNVAETPTPGLTSVDKENSAESETDNVQTASALQSVAADRQGSGGWLDIVRRFFLRTQ